MRTRITAAALLLSAALVGCSNGSADKPTAEGSSPTPAASSSASTPDPTPTIPAPLKMGATWNWESTAEGISGAVTVLDYKQGLKSAVTAEKAGMPAGYEWAVIDVKNCSTRGTLTATTEPWTLAYEDGSRIATSFQPVDLPKPEYLDGTQLTEGRCLRGKIGFMVPGDARPSAAVYAPGALDAPQEWTVPKA